MKRMVHIISERISEFGELCYLTHCGSITYGTQNEQSDLDIQGFFVPKIDYILGMKKVKQIKIDYVNDKDKHVEGHIYEIRKVFELLKNVNPNILEMLYVRNMDVVFSNDIGNKVRDNRQLFLSRRLKHTFSGYACSQKHRLTKLDMNRNNNPARIDRIKIFGYDTKQAGHLIRLLTTAYEALIEGDVHVFRPDRQYIRDIIKGNYTHEEIIKEAERRIGLLEEAYVHSCLPPKVNEKKVGEFLKSLLISRIKDMI